jgi:hypothetical protein
LLRSEGGAIAAPQYGATRQSGFWYRRGSKIILQGA